MFPPKIEQLLHWTVALDVVSNCSQKIAASYLTVDERNWLFRRWQAVVVATKRGQNEIAQRIFFQKLNSPVN